MTKRTVRDYQIRVNSLYVLRDHLVVDGVDGPNTRAGVDKAMRYLKVEYSEKIFHDSGLTRIHWHWTASGYRLTKEVCRHYNDVFGKDGQHTVGGALAESQAVYNVKRGIGVSHTWRANTGAIGLSVAAMRGATSSGSTVDQGDSPMTWEQIDAMLKRTAYYCKKYDIWPSPWTTLTHAEVQENIGIKQRGKWDIRCLPDNPTKLLSAREGGDILRERLKRFTI